LTVAKKEAEEETGINVGEPIVDGIFAIHSNPTLGHFKRGKYVSAHNHLDVVFLFEADDSIPLKTKEDENSNVAWILITECVEKTREPFIRNANKKIIEKMESLGIIWK
jgi:8-oxo-dGTP pyrophosphatase MutT (NUDIX family)